MKMYILPNHYMPTVTSSWPIAVYVQIGDD